MAKHRTVLDFLRIGQVWEYRDSGNQVQVRRKIGRTVVVQSLGPRRARFEVDCSRFRDWFHGLKFVRHHDGTAARETPPDPPRCWTCGSWLHVDKDCTEERRNVA